MPMQVNTDELYHLVMAAHYLNVPRLLDLCTDAMAERIRGKSPAQVRECFGLKPSLSPEEVCAGLQPQVVSHSFNDNETP